MKTGNKGFIILLVLSVLWVAGASYWYACKIRNNCAQSPSSISEKASNYKSEVKSDLPERMEMTAKREVSARVEPLYPGFHVEDGRGLNISSDYNLRFLINSDSLIVPKELNESLEELADYLNRNQGIKMVITGYYRKDENSPALAFKRSRAFKELMNEKFKVDSFQLQSSFEECINCKIDEEEGSVYDALEYAFVGSPIPENSSAWKDLAGELKSSRAVYFRLNSILMNSDPELHQFFTDLKNYTDYDSVSRVIIRGYSDSTGPEYYNQLLSLKRAEDVAEYLKRNYNFDESKFEVKGMGESNPIGDNTTEAGRAKNRRVNVYLKTNP